MISLRQNIDYSKLKKPPSCTPCEVEAINQPRRVSISQIVSYVAHESNLRPDDLLGVRRYDRVCRARWVAIWLCRELTDASYPQIAYVMHRDHSTIIHGYRRAEEIRERFPHQRNEMDRIRKELSRGVQ